MHITGILVLAVVTVMSSLMGPAEAQRRGPPPRAPVFPPRPPSNETVQALSSGIEKFSLTLLLRAGIDQPGQNSVVSPFSVWAMLTLLTEGAGGGTFQQMSEVLRHPKNNPGLVRSAYNTIEKYFTVKTPTIELQTVNAIFSDTRKPIRREFAELARDTYSTDILPVNFLDARTAKVINTQIERSTGGKIKDIVNADDLRDAQMIMTNAIFFKGQWTMPFNRSLTKREPFYDEKNRAIGEVNMMYQRGAFPYVNMKSFQAHVVELPYGKQDKCANYIADSDECQEEKPVGGKKENRLSMLVMVPHYDVPLQTVYTNFVTQQVKDIFDALDNAALEYESDEVDLWLPRFNIESDITMNGILNNMGIHDVFDPAYADLSKLSTDDSMYLSRVIHKAQIEVNEEGTVASAVTAGELSNRNTPPKFVANKPFFYLIIEKTTQIIVFGGTYIVPSLV